MERKQMIDVLISDINSRIGNLHWQPVIYRYNSMDFDEMIALYTACDVALITPLRDGMNLVAKEYCACRTNEDGALILSQFAGAAEQLKPDALLVNPYDIEQMADTVLTAFRMSQADRSARMKRMRRNVRKENVFWWVDSFLKAGAKLAPRSLRLSEKRRSAAALQTQARNPT